MMNAKAEMVKRDEALPAPTPNTLLRLAVEQGADLERLEKLMELQQRWEANEARKAWVAAMNAFKANPPVLTKNRRVQFGNTVYNHASLDEAVRVITEGLSAHGLSHRWTVEQLDGGMVRVTCVITHEMGHSESTSMQAGADSSGSKNSIQAIGSTVTYLERYTLLAATGLAAKGMDDDGNGASPSPPGMSLKQRKDFEAAIEALTDRPSGEALWKTIVKVCNQTKDKPAYDDLKQAITKKIDSLKAAK